jgi:hypothetical protein
MASNSIRAKSIDLNAIYEEQVLEIRGKLSGCIDEYGTLQSKLQKGGADIYQHWIEYCMKINAIE